MRSSWLAGFKICLVVGVYLCQPALAQDPTGQPDTVIVEDTLRVGQEGLIGASEPGVETAPDTAIIKKVSGGHNPRKAALFSAVLPGLGQIYNGKYWKVPIIYGAIAGLGYAVVLSNDQYQLFRRARIAEQNNIREENPLRGIMNGRYERIDPLTLAVDGFRRNRDFVIILLAGLYGLQIMDAIVDAHLIEFDVNEDLALRLQPSGNSTGTADLPNFGISLTLSIK